MGTSVPQSWMMLTQSPMNKNTKTQIFSKDHADFLKSLSIRFLSLLHRPIKFVRIISHAPEVVDGHVARLFGNRRRTA